MTATPTPTPALSGTHATNLNIEVDGAIVNYDGNDPDFDVEVDIPTSESVTVYARETNYLYDVKIDPVNGTVTRTFQFLSQDLMLIIS